MLRPLLIAQFILSCYTLLAQNEHWKSYPDSTIWNFYNDPDISVDRIVAKAGGKRLLLFYFEISKTDINKMNQHVLYDPEVVKYMTENFYLLAIGLDSNPAFEKGYRKFLQEQTYYIQTTPAFSIYNNEGVLRGSKPFTNATSKTKLEFLEFLKKRLN
ncbi:MAG: hypothetical protein R2780_13705 [Crocinitomicaceae bacterium]|nr:hypothetical protein [Crocinitomicaceae bacterium]